MKAEFRGVLVRGLKVFFEVALVWNFESNFPIYNIDAEMEKVPKILESFSESFGSEVCKIRNRRFVMDRIDRVDCAGRRPFLTNRVAVKANGGARSSV